MQIFVLEPRADRHAGLSAELARAHLPAVFLSTASMPSIRDLRGPEGSAPPVLLADDAHVPETIRQWRIAGCANPVVVMRDQRGAARTSELLDAGADDVVVIPVKGTEIRARIGAIQRRAHGLASSRISLGALTVYLCGRNPELDGREIGLTRSELAVLRHLALRSPGVVSKTGLYEALYGLSDDGPQEKIIDVHICHIRRKLDAAGGIGKDILPTEARRGYRLTKAVLTEVADDLAAA